MGIKTGTMTLTSQTAVALWHNELIGQISDGMWENTRPYDHWEFWCDLDVSVGSVNDIRVANGSRCRKNNYGFMRLYPIVGERMLSVGRMAKATDDEKAWKAGEYMPTTFEEFSAFKESGKWS